MRSNKSKSLEFRKNLIEQWNGKNSSTPFHNPLDVYPVDANTLSRDVCNLFFDEDSIRYRTPCECYRCARVIPVKKEIFGGLK